METIPSASASSASSQGVAVAPNRRAFVLSEVAVRLAGAWLLTGALFKLFLGNPKLLPALVRDHSPFTWTLTFQLAIAIELVIVSFAMLRPRIGWWMITALFTFFLVVLVDQQALGAKSCGCLGDSIKMPPLLMMAIDGSLLAFLLATRPWKNLGSRRAPTLFLVVAFVVSIAAPWLVIGHAGSAPVTPVNPAGTPGDGAVTSGTSGSSGSSTTSTTPGNSSASRVWIDMSPEQWVGKTIFDVADLTKWVPVDKIPSDGTIVFWRQGCDHCAAHLREMANRNDPQPVLLVQVVDDLEATRAVDAMPTGASVTQFALPTGAVGNFNTPVEIRLEGGVVKAVLGQKDFEAEQSK